MLRPKVDVEEFEKFGFKPCKGIPREQQCYYLCISRGCEVMFVSPQIFDVFPWWDNDPRIHKRPNCKYRDQRTVLDFVYELIRADMLERVVE